MFDPFTLALIGAGVGGGLSLLRGEDLGGSLKNAAIGGGLGYAGGTYLPSAFGATPATATSASTATNAGGNFLAPTVGEVGMFNSFNPATGAPLTNPAAQIVGSTGEIAPNLGMVNPMAAADYSPLMTRMGQGLSEGALVARNAPGTTPSFFDGMSDYFTPQNVLGAANVLSQQSAAPQMVSGGGGGVRGGQAPSMEEIKNLLNTIRVQELVNRRRFA